MVSNNLKSGELSNNNHRLVAALLFDHIRLMVVGRSWVMESSSPQDPRITLHVY